MKVKDKAVALVAQRLGLIACSCVFMTCVWGCAPKSVQVLQYGRMHEVLGGGAEAAHPNVTLADALSQPHAYAVGALAGLAGEITILDGEVWIARPRGTVLHVDGPTTDSADSAAMLTVAHVHRWDEIKIDEALSGDDLERFVADQARGRGLDLKRPFPFLIEGQVTDLQTHVINGACPMKPGVRLASDQQPWRFQLELPDDARIVGFYAANSVGKLTHPGTSVHAHALFKVKGVTVTAHVERVAIAAGATLRLPVIE